MARSYDKGWNYDRLKWVARELATELRSRGVPVSKVMEALSDLNEGVNPKDDINTFDDNLRLTDRFLRKREGIHNGARETVVILSTEARYAKEADRTQMFKRLCWRKFGEKPEGD